jgi:hypothetical protein
MRYCYPCAAETSKEQVHASGPALHAGQGWAPEVWNAIGRLQSRVVSNSQRIKGGPQAGAASRASVSLAPARWPTAPLPLESREGSATRASGKPTCAVGRRRVTLLVVHSMEGADLTPRRPSARPHASKRPARPRAIPPRARPPPEELTLLLAAPRALRTTRRSCADGSSPLLCTRRSVWHSWSVPR